MNTWMTVLTQLLSNPPQFSLNVIKSKELENNFEKECGKLPSGKWGHALLCLYFLVVSVPHIAGLRGVYEWRIDLARKTLEAIRKMIKKSNNASELELTMLYQYALQNMQFLIRPTTIN